MEFALSKAGLLISLTFLCSACGNSEELSANDPAVCVGAYDGLMRVLIKAGHGSDPRLAKLMAEMDFEASRLRNEKDTAAAAERLFNARKRLSNGEGDMFDLAEKCVQAAVLLKTAS